LSSLDVTVVEASPLHQILLGLLLSSSSSSCSSSNDDLPFGDTKPAPLAIDALLLIVGMLLLASLCDALELLLVTCVGLPLVVPLVEDLFKPAISGDTYMIFTTCAFYLLPFMDYVFTK
jgi:hypothetical protein